MKEKIEIYQQGNTTVLAITNLTETTKKKLFDILIADVKSIPDVENGLEVGFSMDEEKLNESVSSMQKAAGTVAEIPDAEIEEFRKLNERMATESKTIGPVIIKWFLDHITDDLDTRRKIIDAGEAVMFKGTVSGILKNKGVALDIIDDPFGDDRKKQSHKWIIETPLPDEIVNKIYQETYEKIIKSRK